MTSQGTTPQDRALLQAPNGQDPSQDARRGLPQIEVVTRPEQEQPPAGPRRSAGSLLLWFICASALVLIPASIWNFSRPPVYRAAAAVLTVVPKSRSGFGGNDPDIQHVAIQRQLLLGRQLLSDTLIRVQETQQAVDLLDPPLLTPDDLRPLLSVDPIPSTNLIETSATGGKPELLATIVNEWLSAYEALRQREISEQVGDRLQQFDEQALSLEKKILQKRSALEAFRQRHDIVTLERDSNQALKRLQTLQDSLAKAEETSIQARAQLEALRAALANGEILIPEAQASALGKLQQQAAELRVKVQQQRERYTDMFIQSDPNKRALPEQLERIEARIDEMIRQGRRDVINEARQAMESATGQVLTLQRELRVQKITASDFSSSFADYEDLKADLSALETLQRETEGERMALEADAVDEYPQIEIIEPAYAPRDPIQPQYLTDFFYSAAGATAAGLATVLMLLLWDARANPRHTPVPVTGVRIWGDNQQRVSPQGDAGQQQLAHNAMPSQLSAPRPGLSAALPGALPEPAPRQLMGGEVDALWDLAGDHERQLMGLLLSGLHPQELVTLQENDFDLSECRVRVQGSSPRWVPIAPGLCRLFAAAAPLPAWQQNPDRQLEELAARIPLLAMDAGLAHAEEVNPDALRHSYLVYLVRQGARLTELHQIAGPMASAEIQRYACYSPAGASRPIGQIDLTYPALV